MKKYLKSCRNLIFILCLSLILLSCTTEQNIGIPSNSELSSREEPSIKPQEDAESGPIEEPYVESALFPLLDVEVNFSFEDCSCKGNFQKVMVILDIKDGQPPFKINGQSPVNDRRVTFPVPLASSFSLTIISSDNMVYKAKIKVPPPDSCQPPQNQCGDPTPPYCTNKEVQVCEDEVTTIDVCVKWTGNGSKCVKWEQKEIVNTVCRWEVSCE